MKDKLVLTTVIFLFLVFVGFRSNDFFGFVSPDYFPQPVYKFRGNPVTAESFELGRELFYETALSSNDQISCGSCHIQSSAFTQHGHDLSHGVNDRLGERNSPPIMNLAWNDSFFWDGGVFDLDLQSIAPITNHVEMDETMENVLLKLNASPKYKVLFKKTYGSEEINSVRLFKALSHFMVMCVSSDSKYDSIIRKQGPAFTERERKGYAFYKLNCASCHTEPLFTNNSFRNNGLNNIYNEDSGRYKITLDPKDKFSFKVPSLRNLSYTLPYMHDGRFETLEEVLDHYSENIQPIPELDPLLYKNGKPGIPMTPDDKTNLLLFLKTLDDKRFVTRPDLSEQNQTKKKH